MTRPVWVCAALSAALHAALVVGWTADRPGGGFAAVSIAGPATPLVIRLIALPGRTDRQAATALVALAGAAILPAPPSAPPAAEPSAEPPAPAPATPPLDSAISPTLAEASIGRAAAAPIGDRAQALADYVPRPQLTVAPRPSADLLLAYPADGPVAGRFVATVTLYIDDEGWVRRVDVTGDETLPAALRLAARDSFAGTRFSPGEVDGIVVKSRLRIEAIYESRALPVRESPVAALAELPTNAAENTAINAFLIEKSLQQP